MFCVSRVLKEEKIEKDILFFCQVIEHPIEVESQSAIKTVTKNKPIFLTFSCFVYTILVVLWMSAIV